jgi:pimeloyl-ACP methyl ester carboxylesterase
MMSNRSSPPLSLAFQAFGENGPPLVVLHGLFGNGRNWATIARDLAADHRVFTPDLRNHGSSPWADAMGYGDQAADIAGFIEDQGLEAATVIGHSMGGKAAMRLALDRPELVERLVVVDIAPVPYALGLEVYFDALRRLPVGAMSARGEVDAALRPEVPDAGIRAFLLQNLVREDQGFAWRLNLEGLAGAMPAITSFDHEAEGDGPGEAFGGPTLFLAGARSDYVRETHRPVIEALFPTAAIEWLPDAGHWLHAEQPKAFVERLRAFLERSS